MCPEEPGLGLMVNDENWKRWQVDELLDLQPDLSAVVLSDGGLDLSGPVRFVAKANDCREISDEFELNIRVPRGFPQELPAVFETGERIPSKFHQFGDGKLCLGSGLRIRMKLADDPTLLGLLNNIIVPYLYSFAVFEKDAVLPFGELSHGPDGLVEDYEVILGVEGEEACFNMLLLLSQKKGVANKQPCACGSGKRFGECHNRKTTVLRRTLPRARFLDEASMLLQQIKLETAVKKQRLERLRQFGLAA